MAKVEVDTRALERWADDIKNLVEKELDSFFREAALALAAEFLQRVTQPGRTPVGDYPDKIEFTTRKGKAVSFDNPVAGKQGGHLRNSWKIGEVKKTANGYEIRIYNDATTEKGENYASHVEYGHRIMNKKGGAVKGFKQGVFMMTTTEKEIETIGPDILAKRFEAFLRRVMGDG